MSINVNSNIISSTGFDLSGNTLNSQNIVTDGLLLWYDAGNLSSYNNSANYYDCGYGCQYYASSPGCTNCNTQIKDMSGNGYDGTFNGSLFVSYSNIGGSMRFNGPTTFDYVTANDTITHKTGQNFSYECWIYFNTLPGYDKTIVGKVGCNVGLIQSSTSMGMAVAGPGVECAVGNATVYANVTATTGAWEHYVGTYEVGVGIITYKNGSSAANTSYTTNIGNYPNILYVGGSINSNYTSDSYIAIARTYNKKLSAAEVLQNFNTDRQRFGI